MLKDRNPVTPVVFRVSLGRVRPGRFPEALDYFEITDRSCTEQYGYTRDDEIHAALESMGYGVKPTRVPIRLLSDDIGDSLDQHYKLPGKDGMPVCVGDGETAMRNTSNGPMQIPCRYSHSHKEREPKALLEILKHPASDDPQCGKRCPFAQNRDSSAGMVCKPQTLFVFMLDIPSVARTHGAMGRFVSKGERTADELFGSLVAIQAQTENVLGVPILRGLPLDLVMQMRHMQYMDGTGKAKSTRKPVVFVEPRLTSEQLIKAALEEHGQRSTVRQLIAEQRKLLAAASASVTSKEIESEFGKVEDVDGEAEE